MSELIPRLFVLSGPSGAGKGTLVSLVEQRNPRYALAVSATTRSPREGEIDGVSYHFLTEEEFSSAIENDEFVEWADVHGHRYGTLWSEVTKAFDEHRSIILEIDVQGALSVRKLYPEAVLVFIEPPSLEALERRLRGRGTESEEAIQLRLHNAAHEMELAPLYDIRIVNDDLETAYQQLVDALLQFEVHTN